MSSADALPVVSVLMTVYNREPYLAAAIESVLAQSFADIELIVVDDRSSDRSAEVARRYESDPRLRLFVNEKNLGDYPNRNHAASLARGRYVKYVDADDLIYPHCLQVMVEAMERFPEAAYGVARPMRGVFAPALLTPEQAYLDHFFGSGIFTAGPLDAIIRGDALEAIGRFSPERHTSDLKCWFDLARTRPVVLLPHGLVWWRRHEQQESILETRHNAVVAEVACRRLRIALDSLAHADCPPTPADAQRARRLVLRDFACHLSRQALRGRTRFARTLLRLSGLSLSEVATSALRRRDTVAFAARPLPPAAASGRPAAPAPPRTGPPLVSVCIPVCSRAGSLAQAVESVLAQSFTDWELIILDPDPRRLSDIARTHTDDRVRLVRGEPGMNTWLCHNRAAESARGRYLAFLHPDERLYTHALAHVADVMESHPGAGMGASAAPGHYFSGVCLDPLDLYRQEFLGHALLRQGVTRLVFRTQVFRELSGFDPTYHPADQHLQLRLAARHPVALLCLGLVWHPGRLGLPTELAEMYPFGELEGVRWILEMINDDACPLPPAERRAAAANVIEEFAHRVRGLLLRGRPMAAASRMRGSGICLLRLLNPRRVKRSAAPEFWSKVRQMTASPLGRFLPSARPPSTEQERS